MTDIERIRDLEKRVTDLEKDSHPPVSIPEVVRSVLHDEKTKFANLQNRLEMLETERTELKKILGLEQTNYEPNLATAVRTRIELLEKQLMKFAK